MKKLFSAYHNKWYIPVIVAGILGIAGIFTLTIPSEIALYASMGFPFIALIISVILGFLKLFKSQYSTGILQIIFTFFLSFAGLLIIESILRYYPYDYYASNLKIPKHIKLYTPKDNLKLVCGNNVDFEIGEGSQPGIYTYNICFSGLEKGTVFLKAYEVTGNDPLSIQSLQTRSAIDVMPSNEIALYILKENFSIYEGDWGDYYAARFELWFRPQNGKEKKLAEKIYKIEGWMR